MNRRAHLRFAVIFHTCRRLLTITFINWSVFLYSFLGLRSILIAKLIKNPVDYISDASSVSAAKLKSELQC